MSPKDLLYFMEEKFDKTIEKKDSVFNKMAAAISTRLGTLLKELKAKQ